MPKPNRPPNVLEAALNLHDSGLWIVHCNGKGPAPKQWDKKRLSREELTAVLEGGKYNIAIVLNQSDLIDVECDEPEAEPNLQKMFDGEIPPTPTWQSRRGKHRLFRRPKGLPSKAVLHLDGVEFRVGNGKGAVSVVPPSVHPDTGKRYKWMRGLSLDDVEPAELFCYAKVIEHSVFTNIGKWIMVPPLDSFQGWEGNHATTAQRIVPEPRMSS